MVGQVGAIDRRRCARPGIASEGPPARTASQALLAAGRYCQISVQRRLRIDPLARVENWAALAGANEDKAILRTAPPSGTEIRAWVRSTNAQGNRPDRRLQVGGCEGDHVRAAERFANLAAKPKIGSRNRWLRRATVAHIEPRRSSAGLASPLDTRRGARRTRLVCREAVPRIGRRRARIAPARRSREGG